MVNWLQKDLTECLIDARYSPSIKIVGQTGIVMVLVILEFPEIKENMIFIWTKLNIKTTIAEIAILTNIFKP